MLATARCTGFCRFGPASSITLYTSWCFCSAPRVRRLIIHAPLSVQVVTKRGDYTEVDVKRYVRIEKIPGGELSECVVLDGVMFNKVLRLC
jgi:hypothetical protein